jgi:CelD/BcsL family acetyltransferase involved in cellulose biosynthesis
VGDQPNPFRQLGGTPHPSHAHLVHLEGDFDAFLARMRSAKSRSTDRRKRRKLAGQGTLSFVVADHDGVEAQRLLDAVMRQKSANYRELGVADLFASQAYRDFLRALCEGDEAPFLVHLSGLLLDDRIVATHFGLLHKQRLYYLLPAYERDEISALSPGSAHLHYLLQWCFANGVKVCDFTVGDEPYKYLWRDTELELVDYVQPVSPRGRLYAAGWNTARRIKRRIKQSPALLAAVLGWRARLASIGTTLVRPRRSGDQRD